MATATFLNEGMDQLTKQALGVTSAPAPKIRLFTNNHTPAVGDALAAFTQCTLPGYADATITPSSWTGSSTGGTSTYTYPNVTFTFTANSGGTTIYGVVVYDATAGKGTYAFLLDTAYAVPAAGGSLTVALTWQDHQC